MPTADIRLQIRKGTSSEWALENPLLAEGEVGAEVDGGRLKVGNGVDRWNVLPYVGSDIPQGRTIDGGLYLG